MLTFAQKWALTLPFRLAKDTSPNMIMPFDIIRYPCGLFNQKIHQMAKRLLFACSTEKKKKKKNPS